MTESLTQKPNLLAPKRKQFTLVSVYADYRLLGSDMLICSRAGSPLHTLPGRLSPGRVALWRAEAGLPGHNRFPTKTQFH